MVSAVCLDVCGWNAGIGVGSLLPMGLGSGFHFLVIFLDSWIFYRLLQVRSMTGGVGISICFRRQKDLFFRLQF